MAPPPRSVSPGTPGSPNGINPDAPPVYFLLIDGMNEMDSAGFGGLLQSRFKWKNLVEELDVDPQDARRLVDAAHPFLLVRKIADPNGGSSIPVVDPCGECGFGTDRAWQKYTHDAPVIERSPYITEADGKHTWDEGADSTVTFGRHTAYEQSSRFVPTMLMRPRLTRREYGGASHWSFAELDEDLTETRDASLVYVSSHGWLGGFMAGDSMQPSKTAEPEAARDTYGSRRKWFVVGRESTQPFRGPLWIILAQCSTLNSATWALWARMMAGGSPVVRGILGYEEAAPGAVRSTTIVKKFCDRLQAGDTFLEAWKQANNISGNNADPWAAIVHREALGDKIADWNAFTALTANPPSDLDKEASYKGYLRSIPDGEDIHDAPAPFNMGLWSLPPSTEPDGLRLPVTAEHLARRRAVLDNDASWLIAIAAKEDKDGAMAKVLGARLEMVHIRVTYPHQIPYEKIFDEIVVSASPEPAEGTLTHTLKNNVIEVTCPDTTDVVMVKLGISKGVNLDGVAHLEGGHSYLWWRVTLSIGAFGSEGPKQMTHEFRTQGLGC
ncbi:MAG: hypothetical protein U0326_22465 [Polyangiales bacterium]